MESATNLSKNLKTFRNLRHMSQLDFANELGISKSTLHEIEHGKRPTLDTVCCISEHLGVPVSVLLSDAFPPTQMGILVYLIQGIDWFSKSPPEEQEALLSGLQQLSLSLAKMKDRLGAVP